jgi:uncharacterized protein YndB with AHSA1/START domain
LIDHGSIDHDTATNGLPSSMVTAFRRAGNLSVAYDVLVRDERVTRSVVLPAGRDEVWATLTTPEELSAWLGEVVELEPEPGGAIVLREQGSTRRGMVEAAEPGRILSFRWRRLAGAGVSLEVGGATRVTLVLEAAPEGTRLTVTEEPVPLATAGLGA